MKKRKDHYKTLGVKKDASPAEIKRAYRKRAREVHPDTENGDHDAMAELSDAYSVLSDQSRRLLYDSTGEDRQRPIDEEVKGLVLQAFHDAITREVNDCLAHAKLFIVFRENQIKAERSKGVKAQKKLTARRDKVKVKSGENMFHLLVDQQLSHIAAGIAQLDRQLEVTAAAKRALDAYESSERAEAEFITIRIGAVGFDPGGL